jgi:Condensation domain/TubC N-terminal docking domain
MESGTTPQALLDLVERLGVKLWVEEGHLRYSAPARVLTPDLRARLREHKSTVMELLASGEGLGTGQVGDLTAPLSFAQQHFWSLQRLVPSAGFFNVPFAFHLRGGLDGALLRRSADEVCSRHELLRTTLRMVGGGPVQVISPTGEIDMTYTDLRHCPPAVRDDEVHRSIQSELASPFDLSRESCLRMRLFQREDDDHILLFCLHNMIVEDRSVGALLNELGVHYRAFSAPAEGQPSLPALPIQYAEFARWQQSLLTTDAEARLAYWGEWFAKGEPPAVTSAFANPSPPAQPTFRAGAVWRRLSLRLTEQLRQLSQRADVTLFVTILAAYAVLLYRYSGYTDVAVGGPAANRGHWETESLIGSTLSLVAYRFDLADGPDVWTLLAMARDTIVEALTHQDVPFVAIAPQLEPGRNRTNPLFRTAFNFSQATPHDQLHLPGVEVSFLEEITNREIRPDLFPVLWEDHRRDGALTCCLMYRKDLFDADAIALMATDYETLLTAMVEDPTQTIDAIPLDGPRASPGRDSSV